MTTVDKGNTESTVTTETTQTNEKSAEEIFYREQESNETQDKDTDNKESSDKTESENKDDKADKDNKKDSDKTDKESDKDKKEDEEDKPEDLFGKPEAGYDYKEVELPEGMQLNKESTEKFNQLAEKLNLSQKGANEVINLAVEHTKQIQNELGQAFAQAQKDKIEGYKKDLEKDPEIGGAKLKGNLESANKAYDEFASEAFKDVLQETGLNFHPEIVKVFANIGKLMKDDTVFDGNKTTKKTQTAEEIMYPDMFEDKEKE